MYQTYSLTRAFDADDMPTQTFTVSDGMDAINCAHMIAAGFNTMSRDSMLTYVMAVVDTETGTVHYDGKTEQIKRDEPWSTSQTFTFEPSAGDADTIIRLLNGDGKPTFTAFGKMEPEPTGPYEPKSKYEFISRPILEAAYAELEAVKNVLFDAGVETIPADAGVRDMSAQINRRDSEIAELKQAITELAPTRSDANAAARAELIEHVKGSYGKWQRIDPGANRDDLKAHLRGMMAVLSKFLVATGECEDDERHACALRVCGIAVSNYLYPVMIDD